MITHFSGTGDKIYRTGDLGRIKPSGDIQCLGRIDHQVKVRGYRIELEEIEHALVKQTDVKEAVVTAREDTPGDPRLVGYIVLAKEGDSRLTGTYQQLATGIIWRFYLNTWCRTTLC